MNRIVLSRFKYVLTLLMSAWALHTAHAAPRHGWHTEQGVHTRLVTMTNPVIVPETSFKHGKPGAGSKGTTSTAKDKGHIHLHSLETPDPCDADFITPEIQSLADGLMRDPKLIYDYVHNRIDYSHYFGLKKGAQLTLLEKSGNDFDQCSLLVALLRAAGYKAKYICGLRPTPYSSVDAKDTRHWLRLTSTSPLEGAPHYFIANVHAQAGYPHLDPEEDTVMMLNFDAGATQAWLRVWVRVTHDPQNQTVNYYLDPAFKTYTQVDGIDVPAAMGSSKADILAASGANTQTSHPWYAQGLSETGLADYLAARSANLVNAIQTQTPNGTPADILGGWRLVESESDSLNTTPFNVIGNWPSSGNPLGVLEWDNIPNVYHSKLAVSVGSETKSYRFACLQGKRLSLVFAGSNPAKAQLWVDDGKLNGSAGADWEETTGGPSSTTVNVTLSVDNPKGIWNSTTKSLDDSTPSDHYETKPYRRDARYALVYGFEVSQDYLKSRERRLSAYKSAGLADNDWRVRTEALNVLGVNYLAQLTDAHRCLFEQGNIFYSPKHFVGRIAHESSYFIDMSLWSAGFMPRSGNNATALSEMRRWVDLAVYFDSALEHGVLEQAQESDGTALAGSTVRLIQRANALGQKVFRATSANWTAGVNVKSLLVKNPPNSLGWLDPGTIPSDPAAGSYLLVPEMGKIGLGGSSQNTWQGYGCMSFSATDKLAAVNTANGGYFGLPSSEPPVTPLLGEILSNPYFSTPTPITTPIQTGGDPVDLASGAFTLSTADIIVGQIAPRGFDFVRNYNSARVDSDQGNLSYGWTHNWSCYVKEVSDPGAAMGQGTPSAMAAFITATRAAFQTYADNYGVNGSAPELVTVALIATETRLIE